MTQRVLLVGSGGREHALAVALSASPSVQHLYIAPGNGGTRHMTSRAAVEITHVDLDVGDLDGLLAFAQENKIDLTVVGPEAPLAAGIVDRWAAAGLVCFGPTQKAAQLESSKAYAKAYGALGHSNGPKPNIYRL